MDVVVNIVVCCLLSLSWMLLFCFVLFAIQERASERERERCFIDWSLIVFHRLKSNSSNG